MNGAYPDGLKAVLPMTPDGTKVEAGQKQFAYMMMWKRAGMRK